MLPVTTYLFVPATRTDRIDKAYASGAHAVIVDLEDAVPFEQKAQARADLLTYDKDTNHRYWVRINASEEYRNQDLSLIQQLTHVQGVVFPKASDRQVVEEVFRLTNLPIIALIESMQGWKNLTDIAKSQGLFAFSFGALDLANELGLIAGSDGADIVLNRLRADLLIQSNLHGLRPPIDGIYPDFQDDDGLAIYVKRWREMGFSGQMCIHPKQVATIHQAIKPSDKVLDFCQRVVAHFEQTGEFAFAIDGQMVDLPVIERAKQLLVVQKD